MHEKCRGMHEERVYKLGPATARRRPQKKHAPGFFTCLDNKK